MKKSESISNPTIKNSELNKTSATCEDVEHNGSASVTMVSRQRLSGKMKESIKFFSVPVMDLGDNPTVVKVGYSFKKNLGDYNSFGMDVSIITPCPSHRSVIKDCVNDLKLYINNLMLEEFSSVTTGEDIETVLRERAEGK